MNTRTSYKVILFYKYITIEHPPEFMQQQKDLCSKLSLKGRIIIASEGINGTIEGEAFAIEEYCSIMQKDSRFSDLWFKTSSSDGKSFKKTHISLRQDIISNKIANWNINPTQTTGKYLTAEQLHTWITTNKKFYLIDMRNNYEHASGHFENSILPQLETFRDLPKFIPEIKKLNDAPIVTVCTGGIRCEKASGLLLQNNIQNVYQLHGGIITYMKKYPNQHFKGKLYVFDERILIGFNTMLSQHEIIGKCIKCHATSENYINCKNDNCHRHLICCQSCAGPDASITCPQGCRKMK